MKNSRSWLDRRVAQFVHRLHDRVQRRVVAYRRVGAAQVVVDRSGKAHDRDIVLLGEYARAGQRAVAADHHQRRDACGDHVVVGRLAALGGGELLAARRLEDRAALLYDVADTLRLESMISLNQGLVSAHDSLHRESVVDRAPRHRAYCGVHAGRVAARRQDADTFDSGHTLLCF